MVFYFRIKITIIICICQNITACETYSGLNNGINIQIFNKKIKQYLKFTFEVKKT